jgi:hypothetical protein
LGEDEQTSKLEIETPIVQDALEIDENKEIAVSSTDNMNEILPSKVGSKRKIDPSTGIIDSNDEVDNETLDVLNSSLSSKKIKLND